MCLVTIDQQSDHMASWCLPLIGDQVESRMLYRRLALWLIVSGKPPISIQGAFIRFGSITSTGFSPNVIISLPGPDILRTLIPMHVDLESIKHYASILAM